MNRRARTTLFALVAFGALAQADPPVSTLLATHRACDRLVLENLVSTSDAPTLARLLSNGTRAEKLAVLRGAAGAPDPTALLGPMARLMASDDPELAPAAAMALLRVTQRLDAHPSPELTRAELAAALAPAIALARDTAVRPDLRAVATRLDASTR